MCVRMLITRHGIDDESPQLSGVRLNMVNAGIQLLARHDPRP